MKLATVDYTDISKGSLDEGSFTVNASATMFYVTMSGIAKDKVAYPVREVCTNAWDASRGEFEVHLPTWVDMTFRVRDFGPGLSHAQVRDVYTRMFQSTKNDDNDAVGGLGLGCKSPFAYLITGGLGNTAASGAGSFNVTSYQNGIANFYVMSLAADGRPKWAQIGTAPSSERNGLEVSFAVRQGDRERFHQAARDILWSFNPRPKINLAPTWDEPIVARQALGWTQYAAGTVPFHGPIVRMGCVSYPIDPNAVGLSDWPWRQTPIMFDAEIGSLSVQASRESLSYDQRTIDTLSACLKKFEIDYIAGLQAEVDAHPTYLAAVEWWFSQPNTHLMNYLARQVFYRGDQVIRNTHKYSYNDMRATFFTPNAAIMFEPKARKENSAVIDLTTLAEHQILIEYRKGRSAEKIQAAHAAGHLSPDKTRLWLRPATSEVGHQFLSSVGLTTADVILLDSYPLPKPIRAASGPRIKRGQTIKARMLTISATTLDIGDPRSHDIDTPGVYGVFHSASGRRNQLRNRSIQVGDKSAYLSHIQNWLRLADITDKQEILLVDYTPPVPRWSSFKDWFLPVLEAKIDFTQPIYATKKVTTAPSICSEAAMAIKATPNLPTDVSQLIELITHHTLGLPRHWTSSIPSTNKWAERRLPLQSSTPKTTKPDSSWQSGRIPHVLDLHRGDGTSVGAPTPVRLGQS